VDIDFIEREREKKYIVIIFAELL